MIIQTLFSNSSLYVVDFSQKVEFVGSDMKIFRSIYGAGLFAQGFSFSEHRGGDNERANREFFGRIGFQGFFYINLGLNYDGVFNLRA